MGRKIKKGPERESMRNDIAAYKEVLGKCVEELGNLRVKTNNPDFREGIEDIVNDVKQAYNNLVWTENNPNYYQGWRTDEDEYERPDDAPADPEAAEANAIIEGAIGPCLDVEGWRCIRVSQDGECLDESELFDSWAPLFWNEKAGCYDEIVDNGKDPYMIRYQGGLHGFEQARKKLIEYLSTKYTDRRKQVDILTRAYNVLMEKWRV